MSISPAVKPSSSICKGRGKGGLVILWKKFLTKYVSQLKTTNFRLQGIKFKFPNSSLDKWLFPMRPPNRMF